MLDANVRLEDVIDTLAKPVEYVRKALHALHVAQRRHPGSVLRIGRRGDGKFPNYRTDVDAASKALIAAYNGRNHGDLTGKDSLDEANWSGACSTFAEVQAVMREVAARYPLAA